MGGLEFFGAAAACCLVVLVAIAGFLCRHVLRNGGDFEAEVHATAFSFRVHASRESGRKCDPTVEV
jgi:hypothetical protein